MKTLTVLVSEPTAPKAKTLTQEDVWGNYTKKTLGMIVARMNDKCPVFKDKVPYKSVTIICTEEQFDEVHYWLEYVHGADCIGKVKRLPKGKIAIRSNYMCW